MLHHRRGAKTRTKKGDDKISHQQAKQRRRLGHPRWERIDYFRQRPQLRLVAVRASPLLPSSRIVPRKEWGGGKKRKLLLNSEFVLLDWWGCQKIIQLLWKDASSFKNTVAYLLISCLIILIFFYFFPINLRWRVGNPFMGKVVVGHVGALRLGGSKSRLAGVMAATLLGADPSWTHLGAPSPRPPPLSQVVNISHH